MLDGRFILPLDPYFFERPPFCHLYGPSGPQRPPPPVSGNPTILPWLILDLNNPLFKPITQIACYFYPITDSRTPNVNDMADVYSEYYKPLNSTEQYIVQKLKIISSTLDAYRSKAFNITKSQLASFTLHPNVNEARIENDLKYFLSLTAQYLESTLKVFSKIELYHEMFEALNVFTQFTLAKLDADDTKKIDLYRLGEELSAETAFAERCREGELIYYLAEQTLYNTSHNLLHSMAGQSTALTIMYSKVTPGATALN